MSSNAKQRLLAILFSGLALIPAAVAANTAQRPDVQAFIDGVAQRHDFEAGALRQLFQQVEIHPEIIEAMERPYEAKPWHQYRPIFVTQARMEEGAEFLRRHHSTLQRAEAKYGVPAEIITAILGVESRYGRYRGKYRVLDSLATLGFDYPRRSKFFLQELEAFLLLSREEQLDPLAITGSYAGAMGKPQFISSSYRHYAVDFDGDGVRDLLDNNADAIGSVANYLARHGWQRNQPVAVPVRPAAEAPAVMDRLKRPDTEIRQWRQRGYIPDEPVSADLKADLIVLENETGQEYWLGLQNFYAITRYNHSALYAMAVYQLSQGIARQLPDTFSGL